MTKPDFQAILNEAHAAASAAQAGMNENRFALDCGFAWVTLGGNEPLSRWCRDQLKKDVTKNRKVYGHKGYPSGWCWWTPGNFMGQSISIHEAGARAFRDTLAKYNIAATVGSRYD